MKSLSVNPLRVTTFQPDIESVHLSVHSAWTVIIIMFETHDIGQTPTSLERYLV